MRTSRRTNVTPAQRIDNCRHALRHVKIARQFLKLAGAKLSVKYADGLIKSVDGAIRHAERLKFEEDNPRVG